MAVIYSDRPWFLAKLVRHIAAALASVDVVEANGTATLVGGTIQESLEDLAARIDALETAV